MALIFRPGDRLKMTIDGEPVEATVRGWVDERTLALDVYGEYLEVKVTAEHRALSPLKRIDS